MLNILKSIFSQQNITFALSVFGSLGTVWAILQRRRKIKLIIDKTSKKENRIALEAQILNCSHLSVCVTDVVWISKTKNVHCDKDRHISFQGSHRMKNADMHHYVEYTQPFPLQIVELGGVSASLLFVFPEDMQVDFSKPQTFQILTNRGSIKVSLLLPRP